MTKGITAPLEQIVKPATGEFLDKAFYDAVKSGMDKGIGPKFAGKNSIVPVKQWYDDSATAVKRILQESPELPATVDEFSQSIHNAEKSVYAQYHAKNIAAGGKGAEVGSISKIRSEMQAIVEGENIPQSMKD